MRGSWVWLALALGACSKKPAPRIYTCADMAKHGAEIALAEATPERRADLEAQRDKIEGSLRTGCDLHQPSQEALTCFATAKDHPAFMACGEKYFPETRAAPPRDP